MTALLFADVNGHVAVVNALLPIVADNDGVTALPKRVTPRL